MHNLKNMTVLKWKAIAAICAVFAWIGMQAAYNADKARVRAEKSEANAVSALNKGITELSIRSSRPIPFLKLPDVLADAAGGQP